MPTVTIQSAIPCRECGVIRPLAERSIFEGLCRQCFDAHYVLCSVCGTLIQRPINGAYRNRYDSQHVGGRLYQNSGGYFCNDCRNYRLEECREYWLSEAFDASFATYQRIGSQRKYGVEIETSMCPYRRELYDQTHFGCKDDPSIDGAEFDSPILYGDEGLDHIRSLLAFAKCKEWKVDRRCGCHTHYDMRDESDQELYRIAYAYAKTYPMWSRCVADQRACNGYCGRPTYTSSDIRQAGEGGTYQSMCFSFFARGRDRYDYVNLRAYTDHRTFEVRLLEGTLDADQICNWITLHCRFIDCVKKLTFDEIKALFGHRSNKQFRSLVDLIDDTVLTNWLANRARYIGGQPLRGPGSVIY